MTIHKAHHSPVGNEVAEAIQSAAYLAGCHGPVSIRSRDDGNGTIVRNVLVGRHDVVVNSTSEGEALVQEAREWLSVFRKEREGMTGSRVWRWLLKQGRKYPTTALVVTGLQVEYPKDYPSADKAEARKRVEKELMRLWGRDLVEPVGAGDQHPLRTKDTQWKPRLAETSEERAYQKARALARDLAECEKTLRLLRLLAADAALPQVPDVEAMAPYVGYAAAAAVRLESDLVERISA